MAIGFVAVVFAVLAVTEKGGGRMLQLGRAGGLAVSGHVLSLFAAGFAAGMTHPLGAAWLGLLVGVAAIAACAVTRRFSLLVGAGIATLGGVGVGLGVVPVSELFGVEAYRGRGAVRHVSRFTPNYGPGELEARVQSRFGGYEWLAHNWLSSIALVFLVVAVVAVAILVARKVTRVQGAQLLGLTAAAALCALAYDLRPFLELMSSWYMVRVANMLGPSLALAFGAGLGGLSVIIARKVTFARVVVLMMSGVVALGVFAVQVPSPATAIERNYVREAIEFEEMTRVTMRIKREHNPGTYSIIGMTTQRQVLAGAGWFIEQWVVARDIDDVPDDDVFPVPTPDTFVFVELGALDIAALDPAGPSEEYYSNPDKRGRIQAILYDWAEHRLAVDSDTTLYHDGTDIRVYRVARNPALRVSDDDVMFTDYTWRPGELFNEGPTSVAELRESRE